MLLRVLNLATGAERYYDRNLGPVGALVAAYAQVEMKDWNAREYESKYGPMVRVSGEVYCLADWVCGARQA